jgi:hypothetical protein
MKGSILLICISIGVLLILVPHADAACNRTYPGGVIPTTYWSDGPYGTIYVESSPPGAVISVNGANKGHAPVTITGLYQGTYIISAQLSGYQEYTTTTTISGPTRSSVYCPLVPDNTGNGLYVMSNPANANVYLDSVLKGKTPLMLSNTAAGSHTLQLRLSGYAEWKSTVEAPPGGTKTISAVLSQTDTDSTRGLNVSANPGGARVMLDGLEKGFTPISLNTIAAGIHILEIEYPGYNSWKSTVEVPDTGIKEIAINLTQKPANSPGWITISSNPGNASVTLDGNYVGRTPATSSLNPDALPPGEYTIILALPGYKPYSTRITVSPNLISTVNATLVPVSGPFAKGTLSVTSDPSGATILVDNNSIGISPLTAGELAVGDHVITLQKEGYQDYSVSVLVTAGAASTVSATLLPVTSPLHSPVFPFTVLGALGVIGFMALRKK